MFGRDILSRATRSIVGAKKRIGAVRSVEAILNVRRRNSPSVAGLMAGDAAAPVGAQILEEGVPGGIGRSSDVEVGKAALRIGKFIVRCLFL
jgi:hypothetical protein